MSRLVKRRTYSYERLFYLILDGQGKITVNGEEFYPKKDDMVLLPKNSRVSLYSKTKLATINIGATFPQQLTASRYLI